MGFAFSLVAATLACGAIAAFPGSRSAAKALLFTSILASAVAAANVATHPAAWPFLLACASAGSSAAGARFLSARGERWVHRFVIYTGYGATFAAMSAVAFHAANWVVLAAIAIAGSAAIFAAKTLMVRWAAKNVPGFRDSFY